MAMVVKNLSRDGNGTPKQLRISKTKCESSHPICGSSTETGCSVTRNIRTTTTTTGCVMAVLLLTSAATGQTESSSTSFRRRQQKNNRWHPSSPGLLFKRQGYDVDGWTSSSSCRGGTAAATAAAATSASVVATTASTRALSIPTTQSSENNQRSIFTSSRQPGNNQHHPKSPSSADQPSTQTNVAPVRSNSSSTELSKRASGDARKEEQEGSNKDNPRIIMLIRILFLFYYGSLGSLMPYLPVYYHSLGHGGQIIGMLGAVKPFTTFLVAPLWGAISDQTNNPFLILKVTFWVSLVGQLLVGVYHNHHYIMTMVFLTALFNAPVKSLLDSIAMDHIADRTLYGRLRLWGQMGFGLGSSAVGHLLTKSKHQSWSDELSFSASFDEMVAPFPVVLQTAIRFVSKCWRSLTGYKLCFLSYAALSVPTLFCINAFERLDRENTESKMKNETEEVAANNGDRNKKKEDTSVKHGLSLVFRNADAMLFFFLVLVVGISSGVVENFAYVRIREVGGTGTEMGISRLVSSMAGAPMFWFSGPLTTLLGVDRVLVISLLSYALRFVNYATMRNAYHGLPAEALRGVTFAAFWSSATIYAHKVSPPGLHATMLMLVNALYGGLGQSLGAIIGGALQHKLGTVQTFLYSAAVDFALVIVMVVYLGLRSESSFRNPTPIGEDST